MVTALLPALFAAVAPPGSSRIPATVGALTFAVTVIAATAAWSARETYRVHLLDLGHANAAPVDEREYRRLRAEAATAERAPGVRATERT
jgi:hypothetical protein